MYKHVKFFPATVENVSRATHSPSLAWVVCGAQQFVNDILLIFVYLIRFQNTRTRKRYDRYYSIKTSFYV